MERLVGTVSRGIRAPIIREGDDIAKIVADSVLNAAESDSFSLGTGYYKTDCDRCKGQIPGWCSRCDLSYSQPKSLCHLLKRHCNGCKKDGADVKLSVR